MELLEGVSLATWIDVNGRMPAAQAVQTLLPIADALVVAHAHGVVHRDVKPDNILLVPDGAGSHLPKILDFGIAKLLTTQNGRVLTEAGAVLGSLEYMSPEQAEGKLEVGEQTDVWALSVVLYELVTGRRPFTGSTLTAILFSLLTSDPTPTIQIAAGDDELWAIIERGLQKSPADRWPDMRAFGTALASWAVERDITTDATGTSLTHHWLTPPSRPPAARASGAPISTAPTRSEPPVPVRLGTIETTYVAGVTPPRRRTRTIFAAAVAALVVAPVLLAAGLYAHTGEGSARAGAVDRAPPSSAEARVTVPIAAAAAPVDVAPEAAPAPSAVASATPPSRLPLPRRTAPAARRRAASTGMPLPAAPNF